MRLNLGEKANVIVNKIPFDLIIDRISRRPEINDKRE